MSEQVRIGFDIGCERALTRFGRIVVGLLEDPTVQRELTYEELGKRILKERDKLQKLMRDQNPFIEE